MKYRVKYKIPDWKGEQVFTEKWWSTRYEAEIDEFDIRREGMVTWIEVQPDDYEDPPAPVEHVLTEAPPGYGD